MALPALLPQPAVASPPRFDTAEGAEGQPDQARGWDDPPGIEDEDVALFIPRAVLLLPRLVLSAVFWLPKQGFKLIDHYHLVERAERILFFDEAHNFGWMPLVSYQSGYGPTGGAKVFHNALFGHDESLSVSGVYGGRYTQGYRLTFKSDRTGGSRLWLDVQGRYEAEPGLLFGGIGIVEQNAAGSNLNPRDSNELTFLAQQRALGLIRAGYTAGQRRELVKFGGSVIFNHREFTRNSVGKRQLASVYDPTEVPGYEDQVNTLELQANLIVDLRENRGLDTRGTYLEGFIGGVPELDQYAYLHYGFELAHTIDLYRTTRLLRLRVALEAVEGDTARIPFTDLPRLGGSQRLRGYREAQFRDARASLAGIEYEYPIHESVRGLLFIEAGYVAEHYRDLVKLDRWKVGYGGGLLIGSESNIAFQLDLAYGDGFHVYLSTDLAQAFDGRSEQL
jgi:outer membrane protein assembly factor BamA